jgi:hypothetical protein
MSKIECGAQPSNSPKPTIAMLQRWTWVVLEFQLEWLTWGQEISLSQLSHRISTSQRRPRQKSWGFRSVISPLESRNMFPGLRKWRVSFSQVFFPHTWHAWFSTWFLLQTFFLVPLRIHLLKSLDFFSMTRLGIDMQPPRDLRFDTWSVDHIFEIGVELGGCSFFPDALQSVSISQHSKHFWISASVENEVDEFVSRRSG